MQPTLTGPNDAIGDPTKDVSRRRLLAAPALLTLGAATTACADAGEETGPSARRAAAGDAAGPSNNRTLVAYVSRSGNTRVIAGTLARTLDADLFEIEPAAPYPEDYQAHVDQARRERDAGYEPRLKATIPDLDAYDTVYLGFPIWGETTPPTIRSFLKSHDLSGKTVWPFITHGGYGPGSSLEILTRLAPNARVQEAFVLEADQERRTLNQVNAWLDAGPRVQAAGA